MDKVNVALLQMNSTSSLQENLETLRDAVYQAKKASVQLLLLPENFAQMPVSSKQQYTEAEDAQLQGSGQVQQELAELAKQAGLWLVAGSLAVTTKRSAKPFARCLVYNPSGELAGQYDKIHLYDVVHDDGQSYQESKTYQAGAIEQLPIIDMGFAKIGLSICYDLRFPEYYRKLVEAGAQIICVPCAFTYQTGKDHWQHLLSARAIENQCFVLAAAQTGVHDNGRKTWGHSMVIDSWGEVLACNQQHLGLCFAQIDLHKQQQLRKRFPVLAHRRLN